MKANELRKKYLSFFESKGHTIIPSASLVPRETDASTLFTTAGMHPLVPYLLGEKHPGGKRVVNVQKCVRTGDIDDVGDNRHLTFFEMMGNWSFGDYFKKEAIEWSFEFLTDPQWLGLDKNRIYATTFKGVGDIPRDTQAIEIWKNVFKDAGIYAGVATDDEMINSDVKIIPLGIEDNFWIAGVVGPCGGDTEMFYDTRPPASTRGGGHSSTRGGEQGKLEGNFSDLVASGRLLEIWNNVFMEFNKTEGGVYEKLAKPNVDTGMGVERTLAVLNGKENVFQTELFQPLFAKISELSNKEYADFEKEFRIVADHVKASTFMIADGVEPSNTGRGYVLRRLIRRAVRYGKVLGIEKDFTAEIAKEVVKMHSDFYPELEDNRENIFAELSKEEEKFGKTLENGLKQFSKLENVSGTDAFDLYATYGFPFEITKELAKEKGIEIDEAGFNEQLKKHQDLSRTASAGMFKGGLQDSGEDTAKLHTATHLLLASLREVLGNHVFQKGSNITPERLRLDFSHPEKMTPEQIADVEKLVNRAIDAKLEVLKQEMTLEEAKALNAMGIFESKYGDKVTVYSIIQDGEIVSREICGGPHAKNTGELGLFKIQKEEASSAGVRRIKAILEQ